MCNTLAAFFNGWHRVDRENLDSANCNRFPVNYRDASVCWVINILAHSVVGYTAFSPSLNRDQNYSSTSTASRHVNLQKPWKCQIACVNTQPFPIVWLIPLQSYNFTALYLNTNLWAVWYGIVVFNVPLRATRHIISHFRDDFTRQMTQPTVS